MLCMYLTLPFMVFGRFSLIDLSKAEIFSMIRLSWNESLPTGANTFLASFTLNSI